MNKSLGEGSSLKNWSLPLIGFEDVDNQIPKEAVGISVNMHSSINSSEERKQERLPQLNRHTEEMFSSSYKSEY
jgi:hypothetical protein